MHRWKRLSTIFLLAAIPVLLAIPAFVALSNDASAGPKKGAQVKVVKKRGTTPTTTVPAEQPRNPDTANKLKN